MTTRPSRLSHYPGPFHKYEVGTSAVTTEKAPASRLMSTNLV